MSFKDYRSKPFVRRAYEMQKDDHIIPHGHSEFSVNTEAGPITFTATEQMAPGDFIIFESPRDKYHCPREVFLRKYEPDEPSQDTGKTLHNSDVSGARKNVKDIKVFGNGDLFQLLAKASSAKEGWMKSTKAMYTGDGCVVQVTTQQRNPDGSYAVAEALSYVPGATIGEDKSGHPKLVRKL